MRLVITASLVFSPLALADMCQDFCIRELGSAGCSKGSYCKNRFDCHSLFWTGPDQTRVCVFDGSSGCANRFPVLCQEATARLGAPALGSRARAPLRTSPATRTLASATTTSTTSTTDSTTTTTTTTTTARPIIRSYIPLHFNREFPDARPMVDARFLGHDTGVFYSLLLDTSSSFTVMRHPGAAHDTRYAHHQEEHYGAPRSRREMVQLFGVEQSSGLRDTFAHELAVHFATPFPLLRSGSGMLGAGRISDFARAAGVFAYMPGGTTAGTLIIGETNRTVLERHCAPGHLLAYSATNITHSAHHWVVAGSVRVNAEPAVNVNFLVDTTCSRVHVPQTVFDYTIDAINALGGLVVVYPHGGLPLVLNCTAVDQFPHISVNLPGGVSVLLTGREYIIEPTDGTCLLNLHAAPRDGSADLLGMGVLKKLFTVFDTIHDQVGFCIAY